MREQKKFRAVLWDFGGVLTSSPFERFNAFERAHSLPQDFLRQVNARNPDKNAWARFEKNEITLDEFDRLFAEESKNLGHEVAGREVIALLKGEIRPDMVLALKKCRAAGLITGCITNNVGQKDDKDSKDSIEKKIEDVFDLFDHVVESSKIGLRKPDPKIYLMACEALDITPPDAVYLDDLGINLKPARALGMATIKVASAAQAIGELEAILGLNLR